MKNLKALKVDTGDTDLDESFMGTITVITDYQVEKTVPIG
jgi:predicted polyphosphate/ATP-dependent NAD kinase